jgi:hypothetical protein
MTSFTQTGVVTYPIDEEITALGARVQARILDGLLDQVGSAARRKPRPLSADLVRAGLLADGRAVADGLPGDCRWALTEPATNTRAGDLPLRLLAVYFERLELYFPLVICFAIPELGLFPGSECVAAAVQRRAGQWELLSEGESTVLYTLGRRHHALRIERGPDRFSFSPGPQSQADAARDHARWREEHPEND